MRMFPGSPMLLAAAALLCMVAAGCRPAQVATPAAGDAPAAARGSPATGASGTDARATAGDDVDGDIIASTNEPFWNASVSGPVLVLSGIEVQRTLAVTKSDTVDGKRTLVATDPGGTVELEVRQGECQDTMSGAMFPFGAVLVIDGGAPVNGCARPASMPPPGKGL